MNALTTLVLLFASMPNAQANKPVLWVGKDGFPSGHSSPEGVACDLARAFIHCDPILFRETCIKPYGAGDNRTQYESFLAQIVQAMKAEAKKSPRSPGGPKAIQKVFAVRSMSKGGPESYATAVLNFKAVRFVDVAAMLQNGKVATNRTLVIQDSTGKWYVHPSPATAPLLSTGLNQEEKSTKDIASVYTLKQKP